MSNYDQSTTDSARNYILTLKASEKHISFPVTSDGQPTTKIIAADDRRIAEALRTQRPGEYRSAWGESNFYVIIEFLGDRSNNGLSDRLDNAGVSNRIKSDILRNSSNDHCSAQRYFDNGWLEKAYVLFRQDAATGYESEMIDCVLSGFDFMNGLPALEDKLSLRNLPPPQARAAIVEAGKLCSRRGVTDDSPPSRARTGMTKNPSLTCILEKLNEASR